MPDIPLRRALITLCVIATAACEESRPSPSLTGPELHPLAAVIPSGVTVQSFDASRALVGHVSGHSFAFATGQPYALARQLLTGAAPDIQFLGTPEVTPAALEQADIFFIGPISPGMSEAEICRLETYVEHGGALIEARNLGTRPELLGTVPGDPFQTAIIHIVDAASELVSGSYGSFTNVQVGFAYPFAQIGEADVVGTGAGDPALLQLHSSAQRAGRAVLIGDEEVFMTGSFGGERANTLDIFSQNRSFLLNAFAWLGQAPGLAAGTDFSHCEPFIPVTIDIKPGGDDNPVNAAAPRTVIPVAVFGAEDFDVAAIDPSTVAFGPGGATEIHGRGHTEDVDGDGWADMVFHFRTGETGIACGDTHATLTGELLDGRSFRGSDAVRVLGCG